LLILLIPLIFTSAGVAGFGGKEAKFLLAGAGITKKP